jgi:uncharacterized protein with PQ loop repeat
MVDPVHDIYARRKRLLLTVEEYREPVKWREELDKALLYIACASPLLSMPQLVTILTEKSAAGVSLTCWILYLIFSIPWVAYGILNNNRLIKYAYSGNIIVYVLIITAALFYS